MADDAVTALEEAIADLGTLLVQMDKFRAARATDARRLRGVSLAIGDRARRAHRHGQLDPALARELAGDADAARASLTVWLATVRASAPFQQAVAALERSDDRRLQEALLDVYDAVAIVEPPAALLHPVAWQRRGRPRSADEVVQDLVRLRDEGLPGDDDPGAPGIDPSLPGVILHATPPPGAPVYLTLRGLIQPQWVLALAMTGDFVIPGSRRILPFAVSLADPDADDLDGWNLDPIAYRQSLETALRANGLPLDDSVDPAV
jgi:hypothetical protein